jgi:hypothetical protein
LDFASGKSFKRIWTRTVLPGVSRGSADLLGLGIRRAARAGVDIELVSFKSGRRARLDSKTLSKVLHLAMFHGWSPERLTTRPPSASWDTEVIVPYIEPYLFGSVSDPDAASLVHGLKCMLESEALGLQLPVLFAAAAVLAVAENGSFGMVAENAAGTSQLPDEGRAAPAVPELASGV